MFLSYLLQSCLSTTRPVITLIGCNAVGRASRFFGRQGFFFFFFNFFFFFFNLVYSFGLQIALSFIYFATMSIVHLFVSVLLLYVGK